MPWPGAAYKLAAKPHPEVPATPVHDDEVARALAAGIDQRYDDAGRHPRDPVARQLVDAWCARGGVELATSVLCAVARSPGRVVAPSPTPRPYLLRRDGQPWRRLREQLVAADPTARERAKEIARRSWDEVGGGGVSASHVRAGLAYAFCDDAWVEVALPTALRDGYGQLAVLAAVRDPEVLARSIDALFAQPIYQLVEELVPHAPTIVETLGEQRIELIIRIARRAANKPLRKPWLAILACVDTEQVASYLAEVG